MDSLTQIVLGAAIGEAIAGKKAGFRGAMWGACLGTLPDLDILASPVLDNVQQLRFHRGITHSILFSMMSAPLFGWIIHKIHDIKGTTAWLWMKLVLWVHLTHVLIDLATTYGTQMFYPLTDTPFTLDLLFIIDPLYTLPILTGLLFVYIYRKRPIARRWANNTGLIVSTLYLVLAFGVKSHVHGTVQQSFTNQYGHYEILKTTPAGPSIILWNGYVRRGDSIYQTTYSVFDTSPNLIFKEIPRNTSLIEPFANDRGTRTLLWFSRGYYTAGKIGEDIVFYDLRFGRTDLWLTDKEGSYLWGNALIMDERGEVNDFSPVEPSDPVTSETFKRYWNRLWGK